MAVGCCGITDEDDEDKLRTMLARYVKNGLEPKITVKHYCAANKNIQGKEPWQNCGDPEAAFTAEGWEWDTECRVCYDKMNGNKGVSLQTKFVWSIYDTRRDHKISSGGGRSRGRGRGNQNQEKNDYESCTMRTKGRCKHCSYNKKFDDRNQDEIPLEELKELESQGYRRAYTQGMSMLELSAGDISAIEDLRVQARKMCRGCGEGKLTVESAICPECHEEFDMDDLVAAGWDPDEDDAVDKIKCGCGETVEPESVFECTDCDDPSPARLNDVPVRIKLTVEGANNRYNYTFTIAGPPVPVEWDGGEDEDQDTEFAAIIRAGLPNYEEIFKVPSVDEQIKYLGCGVDPITGEDADEEDEVSAAPTVGRAGRLAAKKGKGSKSKGSKGGIVRAAGKRGKRKKGSAAGFFREG